MTYNATKIKILSRLSDGQWWSTRNVALDCFLSLTNTSELLRRYRNQSLVVRQRNYSVPRGYLYHITYTGIERLDYLLNNN